MEGRRKLGYALSLRGRALLALAAGIAVLLGMGIFETHDEASLTAAENRLGLINRVEADNQTLTDGLRVQQSGLRVYTDALVLGGGSLRELGGADNLLSEYMQGSAQVTSALARLNQEAPEAGLQAQMLPVALAAVDWQTWAQLRRSAGERSKGKPDPAAAGQGSALFDTFLGADRTLVSHIRNAAADAADAVAAQNLRHRRVFFGGLVVEATVLALLATATMRSILQPVGRLTDTAQRLAEGRFPPIPFAQRTDEVGSLARALAAWRRAASDMASVFERSPIGIGRIAPDGRILEANSALARMLGYSREELARTRYEELAHADHNLPLGDEFARAQGAPFSLEKRYLRRDGSTFWGNLTVAPVYDEDQGVEYFVAMIEDVDVRKRQELELRHRAAHDSLTGIPNRSLFEDRLAQAIRAARRHGGQLAVLLMDLDRFKPVNDELGHGAGDEVLRQLAHRLQGSLRASDTVARLGGDEFAVLLTNDGQEGAEAAAEKLHEALSAPFDVAGERRQIEASIGIAVYPRDAEDAVSLLLRADHAMYEAKRHGPRFRRGAAIG